MMRPGRYAFAGGAACAGAALAAVAQAQFGGITCSVLDPRPCAPTVCSPLDPEPCEPQYPYPLGETLQVTVTSTQKQQGQSVDPEHKIDTIRDLISTLRACWLPPDEGAAHAGLQMSIRFAFKRTGEIIGEPRVTYTTPGIGDDTRQLYRRAITDALERCTPLPFSKGMGGAIAGRPIAVRFVENRKQAQEQEHQP